MKKTVMLLTACLILTGCAEHSSKTERTSQSRQERSSEEVSSVQASSEAIKSDVIDESETSVHSDVIPGLDEGDEITLVIGEDGKVQEQTSGTTTAPAPASQDVNGLTYVNGILVVNKKHGVPQNYAPGVDPTAQAQVSQLISAMQAQGLNVGWNTSNFRSYEYQSQLYNNYVAANGQASADTFSARPGYSEHQTGLAFDLMDSAGQLLTSPAEAQWLLDHAWEYGFIVRYQAGKEAITGYQAEPWHIRYIGPEAEAIAKSGLTLEEYLNVPGGDY